MNVNKLMINDWVYHKDKPIKITKGIYDGKVYTNDSCILDFKLSPIPLTPEILELNGFKDFGEIKEYYFEEDGEKYSFYLKAMYIKDKVHCAWGTNIGGVLPSIIMYVHELQHALRLCGLTNLADNFKIK